MTCPLCGEHDLDMTMFGKLFVAPCPAVPHSTMRVFTSTERPLVLEPQRSSRNQ